MIHSSLASVANDFKGILLDAFGVFWGGNDVGPLPGAKEAMERLIESGKIVGVLMNSSALAEKEIEKFKHHGIMQDRHFHFLISSGEVSRALVTSNNLPFQTPNKRFYVFGAGHPRGAPYKDIFHATEYRETTHLEDADFIFIGIPHLHGEDQTDISIFRKQIEELKGSHLPMMCTNPDRFVKEGSPSKIVVRQGSIALLYEAKGGTVHYIGKPYSDVYTTTFEQFQKHGIVNPKDILMCGDTPETDIRGARKHGIASALTTETGIMGDRIQSLGLEKAFNAIPTGDVPNFYIRQLADV